MKSTGIIRQMDSLGRVTIPVEIRKNLNIEWQDNIEIFTDGDLILLRKQQLRQKCAICNTEENLCYVNNILMCNNCIETIGKKYKEIQQCSI